MDSVLLVIFFSEQTSGRLTRLFTGCNAYHVGFFVNGWVYDMSLTPRRIKAENIMWGTYRTYPVEGLSEHDLQMELLNWWQKKAEGKERISMLDHLYGFRDYATFLVRWVYRLAGKPVPNYSGEICSEWCNRILRESGTDTPWAIDKAPPSPCDLFWWKEVLPNITGRPK